MSKMAKRILKKILEMIIALVFLILMCAVATAIAMGALWLMVCHPYVSIVILLLIIVFLM